MLLADASDSAVISIASLVVAALAIAFAFFGTWYQARAAGRLEAKKWFRDQRLELYFEAIGYLSQADRRNHEVVRELSPQLDQGAPLVQGAATKIGNPPVLDSLLAARAELLAPDLHPLLTAVDEGNHNCFIAVAGLDMASSTDAIEQTMHRIDAAKHAMTYDLSALG